MELNNINKEIENMVEKIPELYEDGVKESVKESGKVIALIPKTINAALAPLRQWIMQKEYNVAETEKLLAKKLENVGQEKIVSPDSYVAVPAIQAISYSMNSSELRNLYANLLAKAMHIDMREEVHPSFVEIIKQMSPLDSMVFKRLMEREANPMINLMMKNSEGQYRIFMTNVIDIGLASPQLISVSIDNLARMKLIHIPEDGYYVDDTLYEAVFQTEFYQEQKRKHQKTADGYEFSYTKQMIDRTNLGRAFYKVCIEEIS